MKVALTILALVATTELVLGVPVYGPPQPLPIPHKYRSQNGAPIPAKYPQYPPHLSSHSGKNEFYSKFNPHSLPPGLRGPAPQLPPPFAKYPNLPPPGKHQQQQQQHQQHQHQLHHHPQQQQQPHHPSANNRPLGPQFQSKPHLLQNSAPHHSPPQQSQVNNAPEQRVQLASSRPTPKITNVWTGPKLSGSPDFPPRFSAVATPVAPVTTVPFLEKPRGPYIINSDDERGPIKTIPAPNLNPADKPANFEEQLYRAQHQQSYVQPLDNSITDEKLSYQVTEDTNAYKQFGGQPAYKEPSNADPNAIPAVPLDIALQQHLDNQHQQQLSAEQVGSAGTLTPQELYSLLNGSPASAAATVPQTTYMVPQPVMYAVPQPQSLDLQVGHQLQYQAQPVQLQYAQQPAATGVQLQYAQPAAPELQYLQPQTVQYQPQTVQYQPQTIQYQIQPEHVQQQQQQQQQQYQQQPAEQYNGAQTAAAEISAQKHQQQQELVQQQQEQQQQEQEQQLLQQQQQVQLQQQQREQLKHQQHAEQQQQQQQQQPENSDDVQYQQEQDEYEPRNGVKGSAEQPSSAAVDDDNERRDQKKLQSIRDQYYSAVPNEQTAGVLAQIAQSAANSDAPVADEPKPAEKSPSDQSVQMHTSVQIQQSVPLYEGTYASSRRTNQEYADEGAEADELMEGSESVAVSESSSVNGHAPSQFPYSAANINAFAAN